MVPLYKNKRDKSESRNYNIVISLLSMIGKVHQEIIIDIVRMIIGKLLGAKQGEDSCVVEGV